MQRVLYNHVITAELDPNATRWFQLLDDYVFEAVRIAQTEYDPARFLWVRALENAKKWSLVLAACDSADKQSIIINEQHARIGCITIAYRIRELMVHLSNRISENEVEAERKAVLRVIQDAGTDGIAHNEIMRATQRIRMDRKKLLGELVDAEQVRYVEEKTAGRSRPRYIYNLE